MADDIPDNIVKFSPDRKPKIKDGMVFAFRVKKPGCEHDCGYTVDVDERFIECDGCGAKIDPWDIILRWAEKDLRICRSVGHYERLHDKLTKEVAELEKQKKNLQAIVKRLEIKAVGRKPAGDLREE